MDTGGQVAVTVTSFLSVCCLTTCQALDFSFFLFFNLFFGLAMYLAGLVPQPGIELAHPAVKVRNPHHRTPRECPLQGFP